MSSIKFMYIGNKSVKYDNVADTGAVWDGKGDIQEISDDIGYTDSGKPEKMSPAAKLRKYPSVWVEATEDAIEAMAKSLKLQVKADEAAAEAADAAAAVEATFNPEAVPDSDTSGTSDEIIERLPDMSDESLAILDQKESTEKGRKGLLAAIRAEIEKR